MSQILAKTFTGMKISALSYFTQNTLHCHTFKDTVKYILTNNQKIVKHQCCNYHQDIHTALFVTIAISSKNMVTFDYHNKYIFRKVHH